MKASIHPNWYPEAKVVCACGNTFTTGATVPEIEVEICAHCHPFYTGQMKYVDTAGRVDSFRRRRAASNSKVLSKAQRRKLKREKKVLEELKRPDTLAALRSTKKG